METPETAREISVGADDLSRIREAEDHFANERFLKAATCLKAVLDTSLLETNHYRILELAAMVAVTRDVMLLPYPEAEGWIKQGESHGKYDTVIHYKVNPGNTISSRIDTPIESSLLCPFLSILNETDLFHTWMPKWKVPRLGVTESTCLKEMGRGHQIVKVRIAMPYPFDNRECIQHAFAVDSIDEDKAIIVKVVTLDTGKHYDMDVESVEKGYRRVDMDAGIMIRPCPPNHPALKNSRHQYPTDESLLLVTLVQQVDAHIAGVPLNLINFFTRNVMGKMWGTLLQIAEDVKQGKRPQHQEMIASKPELYEWIEQRVGVMLGAGSEATDEAMVNKQC